MKNFIFLFIWCVCACAQAQHSAKTSVARILVSKSATLPDFKKNPVVYGISPFNLSMGYHLPGLKAVLQRLPEIKELGANIIWLQPITPPFEVDSGGYDVMDYRKIWDELGSEEDLKILVKEVHRLGMKLMLDVVLNHSSAEHPFVKDVAEKGRASPYYEWYQHAPVRNIPYAQHFHEKKVGQAQFVYYFWEHLFNFNWQNEELREYLFGTLEYWVQEFDIDGYRFDASWGPSTRWPAFYKTVNERLRSIKPDIILMAEDMAGYPAAYRGSNHPHLKGSGFDWAYDWNNEDGNYISKWSFQIDDGHDSTIFNADNPAAAADFFMKGVQYGQSVDGIKAVRYIENNDTPGSLRHHSIAQAKWAAQVMFMLPGVPLIFYGQEAGNKHEVFELPAFDPKKKMSSYNPRLWSFYQELIRYRRNSAVLSEGSITDIKRLNLTTVTFKRVLGSQVLDVKLDFERKKVYVGTQVLP